MTYGRFAVFLDATLCQYGKACSLIIPETLIPATRESCEGAARDHSPDAGDEGSGGWASNAEGARAT
jgi:hypothetical protein